jgi:hypothetical protein
VADPIPLEDDMVDAALPQIPAHRKAGLPTTDHRNRIPRAIEFHASTPPRLTRGITLFVATSQGSAGFAKVSSGTSGR